MSRADYVPLRFGELEGTSWRRRFVAAEYKIYLDHYPERLIITDELLSDAETGDDSAVKEYRREIISIFLEDELTGSLSPGEILRRLRALRASIFGEGAGVRAARFGLKRNFGNSDPEQAAELSEALAAADRVLLFPGEGEAEDSQTGFLSGMTGADIRTAGSFGLSVPLREEGLSRLLALQDDGWFILTADLWCYLEIFRSMSGFGLVLDNSEWFSRGLFQSPYIGDATLRSLAALQKKPFPADVDVTGVQYCSLSLPDFLSGGEAAGLTSRLNRNIGCCGFDSGRTSVSCGFYDRENGWEEAEAGRCGSVFVTAAVFHEDGAACEPLLFSSCRPAGSADSLPAPGGRGALTSFNYYFTANLAELYNRELPERQRIPFSDFFIDYQGYRRDDRWFETLPLYNKAYIGCTAGGRLFAGHYSPSFVKLYLGEDEIFFGEDDINPAGTGDRPGLYLPSFDGCEAGEGFSCLVIVQDRIICSGPGPFRIPPVGAVAVLDCEAVPAGSTVRFEVGLGGLPCRKESLKWLFGGFNLLIEDGENLYPDEESGTESLRREGWLCPQSAKTQETQLLAGIRQPRLVFGRTRGGRLFAVQFAGRTRLSGGASFEECADFVFSKIASGGDEIDFCINFDGGASAAVIGFGDGFAGPLSFPAPSAANPAGTARPLPAYFSIKTD